jgi:hypothetical protein
MKKLFIYTFCLLTFGLTQSAKAQVNLGLDLMLGLPQGEFKENVGNAGGGITGQFLWNPSLRMPFSAGLNLGLLIYGRESRREPFSTTIPDVTVRVDRTNNLVNFHLLFRIIPQIGDVRPYLEGLFGGAYLFTETKIENTSSGEEIVSSVNFDDFAWNYGFGSGLMFCVHRKKEQELGKISEIFVDLKARYLYGTRADYLREGSIKNLGGGKIGYDVVRSTTDLISIHLGAVMFF